MKRFQNRSFLMYTVAACLASAGFVYAADNETTDSDSKAVAAVKKLNSSSSAERAKAREDLLDLGVDAVAALKQSIGTTDAQTSFSAIRLLGKLRSSNEDGVQQAAEAALKEIAAGKSKAATRAQQILKDEPALPELTPADPVRGQNISVSRSNVNGFETVTANDGEQRVTIEKQADGKIEMEIRPTDRKKKTITITANSEKELKAANKQAWETYDRFMNQPMQVPQFPAGFGFGGGGRATINAGGKGGFNFQFPNMQIPRNMLPGRRNTERDSVQQALRLLKESQELLQQMSKKQQSSQAKQLKDKLDHLQTHLEILNGQR